MPVNDRDKAGLRGPVKGSRGKSVVFLLQADGRKESHRHLRGENYDPDGRLIESWWRNPDGKEHRTRQVYDE